MAIIIYMMKCVVEANIPFIRGILEPFAQVVYLEPEKIVASEVADADALIVRTRTQCNEALLSGSKCRFIGTATIGTDHIDKKYCENNGITVVSAPGCNAPGVAQYVLAVAGTWMKKNSITSPSSLTLGVVGVGHVGSIISRWAEGIGFNVLRNDPPREREEGNGQFVSIDTVISQSDIITFHTPLIKSGIDATYHLCNSDFLNKLNHCSLIINSARGSIVDTEHLIAAIKSGKVKDAAIDCWEKEPDINTELLSRAFVATPHIAGYSREGKSRATHMILAAIARHFSLPLSINEVDMGASRNPSLDEIIKSYNPLQDTIALKNAPELFESFRNNYNLRAEV